VIRVVGRDVRWTEHRWAQRWTSGLIPPGHEGPLPWWLAAHRVDSTVTGGYDIVTGTTTPLRVVVHRSTHPQDAAYCADWSE
jgi:hypothetical protein